MSTWSQTVGWLTDPANYSGPHGVPARILEHVAISGVALGIGAAVALPLGVWLGHARRGGLVVTSVANAARAVPTLGVLILFAVGPLGIGTSSAIAALTIFSVPPMLTNAYTGVQQVDPELREAAVGMGMRGRHLLTRVEVPLALPLIAAGLRISAVQVWATATLAAVVGSGGLGRFIIDGYGLQRYGEVWGGVVYVAAFAIVLEGLLGLLQRALARRLGGVPTTGRPEAVAQPA